MDERILELLSLLLLESSIASFEAMLKPGEDAQEGFVEIFDPARSNYFLKQLNSNKIWKVLHIFLTVSKIAGLLNT